MHAVLRSLHVYPVKSLRGIDLDSARLTPLGLEYDRAWLLVDARGHFMSQRQYAGMARIGTRLSEHGLELSIVGQSPLYVPFATPEGRRFSTRVWDDECLVLDEGDEAARWFAGALKLDAAPRLVRMAPEFKRGMKRPERYGEETTVHFADTAPLLIANLASLRALNVALEERGHAPVPMDRFRANLVVEGLEAFSEHAVQTLEGENYRLGLRYPRERCVMTTMDQSTGARDPSGQPFALLREINPMPENPKGPAFGELAVVEAGEGTFLRAGDRLAVGFREAPANPPRASS
jgi:uncharacterized protein YcbX